MMRARKFMVSCGILVFILALVLSAGYGWAAQEKPPIKLGGLFLLSGRAAVVGLANYHGALLAVDEINAKGGVLGRKLELLARDSKAKPDHAVKEATLYIVRDKVDFLYGTAASHVGLAVAQVAKQYKKILISPEVTTDRFTVENFNRYIFRTDFMNRQEEKAAALYLSTFPYKRLYIIGPDYEYGHNAAKALKEELKKLRPDIEIIGESWPKLFEPDYTPHIQKILEAKPDALYSIFWGGDTIAFIKQAIGFGLFDKIPFFSVSGVGDVEVHMALGKDMPEGLHGGVKYWFDYPYTPANKDFVSRYYKKFGKYPSLFTMSSYIGIYFLAEAVKKAGTTETEKVIEALEGLTIDTPIGKVTMRKEDHQIIAPHIWGKTCKSPKYDFLVLCDLHVFPGEKITPSVEEVLKWRAAAK